MKTLETGFVDLEPLPPAETVNRSQVFLIVPSLLFGGMGLAAAILFFLSFRSNVPPGALAVLGAFTIILLAGSVAWPIRLEHVRSVRLAELESNRMNAHRESLERARLELERRNSRNSRILHEYLHPSSRMLIKLLSDTSGVRRLWERSPEEVDFLCLRLGTGSLPSLVQARIRECETEQAACRLKEEYAVQAGVPVVLSFREERHVGLLGDSSDMRSLLSSLIIQMTFLHAPDELKIAFIGSGKDLTAFDWIRHLPHFWCDALEDRYIATSESEVRHLLRVLAPFQRNRDIGTHTHEEWRSSRGRQAADRNQPHLVLIMTDSSLVDPETMNRLLSEPEGGSGVTVLYAYGILSRLPRTCRAILQAGVENSGFYIRDRQDNRFLPFLQENPDAVLCAEFGKRLASRRTLPRPGAAGLPENVPFLDLFEAGAVSDLRISEKWRTGAPQKSLAVPVGVRQDGARFLLDIHEDGHGPHGLIAGMTGSGKSEFLMTFLLSLAVHFHPHDVSFLIIDFKGGGMAGGLADLPHLVGTVTNLSGASLHRALIAIRAELKRRQQRFAAAGVNRIDRYQALWKEGHVEEPMPHLIVACDEFARLKVLQPEFLRELIDVAQIGRSLGFHLILATQRPNGIVDDRIWGNSRLRVCLKVLDRQDSHEILRRPDAADIRQSGRCCVQVGNDELFVQVQGGYGGVAYVPRERFSRVSDQTVSMLDICGRPVREASLHASAGTSRQSQADAVAEAVRETARILGVKPLPIWMPVLPRMISLEELAAMNPQTDPVRTKGEDWLSPRIGLADDPEEQIQFPVAAPFGSLGHLAVYGASGSGKTTLLQTLLFSLCRRESAESVRFSVLDFNSRILGGFSEAPHCEAVAFAEDETGIRRVLNRLTAELERRRFDFSRWSAGSLPAYLSASGRQMPAHILCIDGCHVLHERYPVLEEQVVQLARDGKAYGLFLVLTGSTRSSIPARILDSIRSRLVLQMNDRYAYRDILGPIGDREPDTVPGRGLLLAGRSADRVLEFQTALAVPVQDDTLRALHIRDLLQLMAEGG